MGIRDWFAKLRKEGDEEELRRVEEERGLPLEERERLSGDVEGLGADERTARRTGESSTQDFDRF
ncbi:MAG: hypothetical protein ACTHNU_04540 [Gaiellales bacterium]